MANVGHELALIVAGTPDHFNACTVMYGAEGMIWSKDAYFAFVKPERYTWQFIKDNDYFTVCYFPKEWAHIHKVFGYESGRDVDKVAKCGIHPEFLEHGIAFEEASEVYVCHKMYMRQMEKSLDPADVQAKYADPNDLIYGEAHYAVIGQIVDPIVR